MKSQLYNGLIILSFLAFGNSLAFSQSFAALKDSIDKHYAVNPSVTIKYINKVLPYYKEQKDWENYVYSFYDLSYHFYLNNDMEESERKIEKALFVAKQYNIDDDDPIYSFLWNFKGVIAYEKKNITQAIKYFKKGIVIDSIQENPSYEDISAKYSNVAQMFNEIGDYEFALYYLKKALSIEETHNKNLQKYNLIHLYNNIGFNYQCLKMFDTAHEYYQKGLKLLKKSDPDEPDFNENYKYIYFNLATNQLNQGNLINALNFFEQESQLPSLSNKDISKIYTYVGETFLKQNKTQLALDTLDAALKLRLEAFPSKHNGIATTYRLIGNTYFIQKDYTKALENYQLAIIAVVYDFEDKNINKNPSLDNPVHQIELLKSLSAKAKTLHLMKKYEDALEVYQLCSQLIDQMRTSFQHNGSKLFLMEEGNAIFEKAIETALTVGDKKIAFELAEKSKSMLLLEAMRGTFARYGLPKELVEQENSLKIDITYYERKIWEERQKNEPSQENIKRWENLIFDLKERYTKLKEQFNEDYPEYYQLKYNNEVVSVKDVQRKLLDNKTAMVSYFIGENQVFIFTITKKGVDVTALEKTDNLTDWVENMRLCLQRDNRITNLHEVYYQTAFQLYTLFLEPAINDLSKNVNRLIIIPDDQLNFIPFETLLTANLNLQSPRYELKKIPYLIRDYQITYGYSATLLEEGMKKQKNKNLKSFGGFVPSFQENNSMQRGCDGDILGNLPFGRENIATINDIMNGQLHFDDEATLDNFTTLADQYKILHLCTHACAEIDSKDTRIYFSDKELLAFELYNMPLNAELAVLSACETGIGELKRGEGVMSLARAFMYSGCPSVVTSLWSVDDKSTSEVMRHFYQQIKDGKTKDEALHEAKLNYLDGKGIEASHPFYWSGFVHIGNTEPLFGNDSSINYWYLVGLGLILLLIGFYFTRKK